MAKTQINYYPIKGKWVAMDQKDVNPSDWSAAQRDSWEHYQHLRQVNPLSFFIPHGAEWSSKERVYCNGKVVFPPSVYPKEWKNDGVAFLNDWENGVQMLVAPNQNGKTTLGVVKDYLFIGKCNPEWDIFKHGGVECPEWTGPKTLVAASYSWDNVGTLWNRMREFWPRAALDKYAPNYGKYPGETGKGKNLSFGDGKPKRLEMPCGSVVIFLCYTQQQIHWEGFVSDGIHADEQVPEEKFVGWSRSTITRGDFTPMFNTLTGHTIEDRPDTGAGGWLKTQLWDGRNQRGRSVGKYRLSFDSTPDAVISPKKKKEKWLEWADPSIERSEKQQRAAVARYFGGWEEGSGLVLDEWDRQVHVINRLWDDDKVPKDWTKWRIVDYGVNGVTCCSWWAVAPQDYIVLYRLMYQRDLICAETAKLIIEMSGNKHVKLYQGQDERTGESMTFYEEQFERERYYNGLLDSRSASIDKEGHTLLDLFGRYGLHLSPACGQENRLQVPRVKELLKVDYSKPHIQRIDDSGNPVMGAARVYFFDDISAMAVSEIETLQKDPDDSGKIRKKSADHFFDTFKYFASDNPHYFGDIWEDDDDDDDCEGRDGEKKDDPNTPFTGY